MFDFDDARREERGFENHHRRLILDPQTGEPVNDQG